MAGSWAQIDPRLRGDEDYEDEDDDYEGQEAAGPETRLGYNPQINSSNYDPQLDHDRQAKKELLQRRFESIFAKYGRDFEGVGDEIEMETGLIVVDNGHLKNMRHEGDPGYPEAAEFANPTVGNLGAGVDQNMTAESGSEDDSDDERESLSGGAGNEVFSPRRRRDESMTTPFETEDSAAELAIDPALADGQQKGSLRVTRSRARKRKRVVEEMEDEVDQDPGAEPQDISQHLESLKASMLDLQSKHKQGHQVNSNDIEALGLSIARQLADFVGRDKKTSKATSDSASNSMWAYPELPKLPHQETQQRRLRSPSPLPLFTGPSPGQKSLWAPIQHPRPRKKYKRRKANPEPEADGEADKEQSQSPDNAENAVGDEAEPSETVTRTCTNCECNDSLIWRPGPDGGDLCNACGMYYYRYGLIRPLEAPQESEASDVDDYSEDDIADRQTAGEGNAETIMNEAQKMFVRLGRGRFKSGRFKMEDDAELIKLKEIDRLSWERIAKHFPGRTAYGVQCRYSKKLHNRPVEARAYLVNQGYESRHDENGVIIFAPAPQQVKGWTDEEDDLLLKLRDEDKLEWDTIAESFPGRNARAMERRFTHLERRLTKQRSNRPKKKPKKRKDPRTRMFTKYSIEEDDQLIYLREVEKLSWAEIAQRLPGRNAMAMQKRYVRELAYRNQELGADPLVEVEDGVFKPTRSKHARFTREEDEKLLHMRNDLGLAWKEIEFQMPGRKWQSLENRYQYMTKGFTRYEKRKDAEVTAPAPEIDPQLKETADVDAAQSEDELIQDKEDQSTIAPCSKPLAQTDGSNAAGVLPSTETDEDHTPSPQGHGFFSEGNVPFTNDEDTSIRQLRELEKLSWDEIAKSLPGRSVAAISARYYQHLFPQSEAVNPWAKAAPVASFIGPKTLEIASRINLASSEIASKRTLRWTKEESDMVVQYYNQGLDFEQIGEKMPWRSHKAIQHHYVTNFGIKKSAGKLVAPSLRNSLLRQAVDNTTKQSVPAQSNLTSVIDLTGGDGDDESPSRKRGRPAHKSREQMPPLKHLLPRLAPGDERGRMLRKYAPELCTPPRTTTASNALPHAHPPKTPQVEAYASLLSKYLAGRGSPNDQDDDYAVVTNALTPSRDQPSSTTTVDRTTNTVNYFTPAPHNFHSHPYFVQPPAAADKRVPLFSEHGLSTQRTVIDPRLLEDTFSAPPAPLSFSRTQAGQPHSLEFEPVSTVDEPVNDDMTPQKQEKVVDDDDDAMLIGLTGPEPDFFLNDDDTLFEGTIAGEPAQDEDRIHKQPAEDDPDAIIQSEREQDPALQPHIGNETNSGHEIPEAAELFEHDQTSTFEDEAVDTGETTELDEADPESVANEVEPMTIVNGSGEDRNEILSPLEDQSSMHDSGFFEGPTDSGKDVEETETESDGGEDNCEDDLSIGTPPPQSWDELLLMAFEAHGITKSMNVKDIYNFIEDRFPYYKNNTSAWKDGIQGCLEERPEFVKVSRSRPLWVFKKILQHAEPEMKSQSQIHDSIPVVEPELVAEAEPAVGRELEDVHEPQPGPVRLITVRSLRERPRKPEQVGQVKNGPGRPRQDSQKKSKTAAEDSFTEQKQAAEPATIMSDDADELAPSPDKIAAYQASFNRSRASSMAPALSSVPERLRGPVDGHPPNVTRAGLRSAFNASDDSISEISRVASSIINSSSPLTALKTPGTAYSKADTPGTSHSTLFGRGRPLHPGVAALRSSVAPGYERSRSSSVTLPNSRKRVVYTPVRDVEGDEDELS